MFTSSLLLFEVFLASTLLQVLSFDIKIGSTSVILKDYNFSTPEDVERSGLFVRRTLVFPYDVYEMPTRESPAVEAKSYLFVKMPYELLTNSFDLQNRSL
jgi:hypothetical protein